MSGIELLVSSIEGSVDFPFSPLPLRLAGLAWPLAAASAGKLLCPKSLWLPAHHMQARQLTVEKGICRNGPSIAALQGVYDFLVAGNLAFTNETQLDKS